MDKLHMNNHGKSGLAVAIICTDCEYLNTLIKRDGCNNTKDRLLKMRHHLALVIEKIESNKPNGLDEILFVLDDDQGLVMD